MDYIEFVNHLRKNMPNVDELVKLGYSKEEIDQIQASYLLENNDTNTNKYPELKDMGWLFSKYNLSNLTIGLISFLEKPIPNEGGYIIGNIETDNLLIDLADESIFVRESGYQNVLWQCGNSICNFISALAIMSEHFSKVMVNEDLYNNFEYLDQVALEAGKKAGGDIYIRFYRMLLGI